jgi:hypothetical protein
MAELHEVLAVEGDLEGAAKNIMAETEHTFKSKAAHFMGATKRYEPFDAARAELESFEERTELTTTVHDKLAYMFESFVRHIDAVAQKDATNQNARGDIIVNGVAVVSNVPSQTLLTLEKRVARVREIVLSAPTIPPGAKWERDEGQGEHVWRREQPDIKFRTQKTVKHKILTEATPHHPAQIERWNEDENIGRYVTDIWSGALTSAEKSAILNRIDALSRAIKQARQRANTAEVVDMHVGEALASFILSD